jgi:hypothetical protein
MADYCGWCSKYLPLVRREPRHYEKEQPSGTRRQDLALCENCEDQAKREGWKLKDSPNRG